jgi:hypothetical protein
MDRMQAQLRYDHWIPAIHDIRDIQDIWANSGGPRSRSRVERIKGSLLGQDDGSIRCPRTLHLALDFGGADPVATVFDLLEQQGIANPEDLRLLFPPPAISAICRANPELRRIKVATASPELVLKKALMLGLCTPWLYDPARPVLWTRASLERRLELFDGEGFYAC